MQRNKEVTTFINSAPTEQKKILEKLRNLIFETVPQVEESFKWNKPVYKTEKFFCYLSSSKNHATLGFNNFEKINDTYQILEGTGKSMRHIKIKNAEELQEKVFQDYILVSSKF